MALSVGTNYPHSFGLSQALFHLVSFSFISSFSFASNYMTSALTKVHSMIKTIHATINQYNLKNKFSINSFSDLEHHDIP